MIDLLNDIDCLIGDCLTSAKAWGLARIVETDTEKFPCAYKQDGSQGEKITPNDKWKIAYYHRLLNESAQDNDTYSFGRTKTQLSEQQVRTILIVNIKEGHNVIEEFLGAFGGQILENANFKYAQVGNSFSVNKDSAAVWEAEWDKAYKDKFQMRYLLYAIEYSIEYIPCMSCECN